MSPFKPSVSYRHTATLIDNKLYILGGLDSENIVLDEFFCLDVSVPFNTQELPWQDLSNINLVPVHMSAALARGGANNDTLFLYGGTTPIKTMSLVYTFNSRNFAWSIPKITEITVGINMIRKYSLTGIIDNNGKLYLWGGMTWGAATGDNVLNEMLVLDTIKLNWNSGSIINAPTPRREYGATLLPDNKIIYLGGDTGNVVSYDINLIITKGVPLKLSEVYIYDTINDSWDTKIVSGNIPSNRGTFSTVLGM
ncbi:hypothetical protein RhiirA5_436745 [Rhizophagus irregularis]|uniref:Galactose oxidase n=1 Tax=Rhizophagus irregularis TaxID=588596 RepID=A0A2N0NLH3_9GLOM|nr:hypothetical protein RhiirA5_436745 [Rhizophagus irregularis]